MMSARRAAAGRKAPLRKLPPLLALPCKDAGAGAAKASSAASDARRLDEVIGIRTGRGVPGLRRRRSDPRSGPRGAGGVAERRCSRRLRGTFLRGSRGPPLEGSGAPRTNGSRVQEVRRPRRRRRSRVRGGPRRPFVGRRARQRRPPGPVLHPQSLLGFQPVAFAPIPTFPPPEWEFAPDGATATQTKNAQPALLVSDFPLADHVVELDVLVDTMADGDAVGIAIGFSPGEQFDANARWWLLDWRRTTQHFDFPFGSAGGAATRGFALSLVKGVPDADQFWHHGSNGTVGVEELARGAVHGDVGWVPGQEHTLRVEVGATNLRAWIDGELELDVDGDFADAVSGARFAAYDFSQVGATFGVRADRVVASVEPYGKGTPGALGVPEFEALTLPVLGGELVLRVSNAAGSVQGGCIVYGVAPSALDLGVGVLLVDPHFVAVDELHPLPVEGATVSHVLPDLPQLEGLSLYAQFVHFDPGAPTFYAWSRGLRLGLGE
ncbi:MAG: hypothetical protein R3F34_06655 [Planctomycetota bacterium]